MHVGILSNVFINHTENKEVETDLFEVGTLVHNSLISLGYRSTFFDADTTDVGEFKKRNVDILFNVCERLNNDIHTEANVASMLEGVHVPFTGSSPSTISLCNNKAKIKSGSLPILFSWVFNSFPMTDW